MILTNLYNVPAVIYKKIEDDLNSDPYKDLKQDGSIDFRTTELLGPPLPKTLWDKHKDSNELVIDVNAFLAVQFGQIFHSMCEGVSTDDLLYEYQASRTFDYNGKKVTVFGTLDELEHLENGLLVTDNKTCLMSNLGYEKPEYNEQLNVYLHLLRAAFMKNFVDIRNVQMKLRYFIKDYTPSKKVNALARASNPYTKQKAEELPDSAIYYKDVPVYTEDCIETIIMDHIADHLENPERVCTAEERWDTLPKVAVMLTGNKTAKKLCGSAEEAQRVITGLSEKDQKRAFTEARNPKPHERDKRCQYYCNSASVCPYAKSKNYC